jgi:two-component system chemotaxis response regulator CheB
MSSLEARSVTRLVGSVCRVMVVDDSAVIRGFIRRTLEEDDQIEVVASAGNGKAALEGLARTPVDVIILDIEMPVMDGMTALPELLKVQPDVKIIMASTLTLSNAEISLEAMSKGAADYIPKPTSTGELHSGVDFKRELLEKVKAHGKVMPGGARKTRANPEKKNFLHGGSNDFSLRAPSNLPATVLAIGSSTGGPQALMEIMKQLGDDYDLPILVTQHMPATFTSILAQHISKASGHDAREAVDGEEICKNRVYIAPGDFHMIVESKGGKKIIRLNQEPPENFCRPGVDPMLRSMAPLYNAKLLTVILTGMGHDGRQGAGKVIDQGGTVIAQDEATSVVWGMPGAVATAGACCAVLPLKDIAAKIRELSGKPPK